MSVRCEGDIRIMEQLGERQDFEAELTRLGLRHEDFRIYARRSEDRGNPGWSDGYAVCVTNTATKRQNIYWGGAGKNWVAEFSAELASGFYGAPTMNVMPSLEDSGRPRIVARDGKLS